jgi:hypothetical protein
MPQRVLQHYQPIRCLTILLAVVAAPALAQTPDSSSTRDSLAVDSTATRRESADTADTALVGRSAIDTGEVGAPGVGRVRRHAIEYSNGYATRLTIHRIGSYAELPLFGGEWILGQKLLNDRSLPGRPPRGLRDAHRLVATGLGVLFGVNTVTGVWNLIEARHDPAGRTRRTLHAVSMLVADAGFLYTASLAHGARHSDTGATNHRNAAIASISLATASTLMMWLWKQ